MGLQLIAALPARIVELETTYPVEEVETRVRDVLCTAMPSMHEDIARLPKAVFGVRGGFFYLPAALCLEWAALDEVNDLLTALALGHSYFAFQDLMIDEGGASGEFCLISHGALMEYFTRLARWIVAPSPEAVLLEAHHRNYLRYVEAQAIELNHRRQLYPYSWREVQGAGGKAAPGNTILEIIAMRCGVGPNRTTALIDSVMSLCAGLQVIDDLNDLAIDHRDGNATFPLTEVLVKVLDLPMGSAVSGADIELAAAASGVADACCRIADRLFARSMEEALLADALVVEELASTWRARVTSRRARLGEAAVRFAAS